MYLPRPRSLNGLVLTGFSLVALPLLFAVGWALIQIDGFARSSQTLLTDSTSAAEQSGKLLDAIAKMERQARQYQVLEDPESIELAAGELESLATNLGLLAATVDDPAIKLQAAEIEKQARIIDASVRREPPGSAEAVTALDGFAGMRSDAKALAQAIDEHIDAASAQIRAEAARAKRTLTWQTIAIIPVTLGVVLFFTVLIGRPIRQLDRAISQLGQGGFSQSIEVEGPTDLRALGRQLEWLRVRLLELAQEKNRFLRHMSHELKTPLANIREGTDLLLEGAVGELAAPQQEVTTILRNNGLKLQQLIENLLSFSSWQTKSETLMLGDFDLAKLVASVVRGQQLAIKAQEIRVHEDIDDIVVSADREKMRTMLDNLLSNAVKFTPRGGDIYMKARGGRRSFQLEIADTGPGIPAEEQRRVFDAFYQGTNPQAGPVAGTGIGLSVVQECIEAHGGSIEIVNGEYRGAHFRIHMPQERIELQPRMVANA